MIDPTWANVGLPWWSYVDTWTGDGTKLLNNAAGFQSVAKYGFWLFNISYWVRITVRVFAGWMFGPWADAVGDQILADGTYAYMLTPLTDNTMYISSTNGNVWVTALSIKRILEYE